MHYRHIKPHLDAYAGRDFPAHDAATTMERIADVVRWHTQGSAYREPEDALSQIFVQLCLSEDYGEPRAIPSPLSFDESKRREADAFDEVMRKPVPANLWGER